jgi:NAD(P)-dependent dehydrogenase (short-subunit alcohol dehydrogenase family)
MKGATGMAYFITGATGFIGRHLLECLLERGEPIYCLVRECSVDKLQAIAVRLDAKPGRIIPMIGDLQKPLLGTGDTILDELRHRVTHFFHVAALYDMNADSEALARVNVDGTRNALELAVEWDVGLFHHISSIAVAGHYPGVFTEAMFDEAEQLDDPYACTKHDAEALVRTTYPRPYQIYRPGIVVGHSETGEIDKVDGPYYLFPAIQRMRKYVPAWLPRIGIERGSFNLVPVDFVARAIDYIAHEKDLERRTFHLVDPDPSSAGEIVDTFCRAARTAPFTMHVTLPSITSRAAEILELAERIPAVSRFSEEVLKGLGLPRRLLGYLGHSTTYDASETVQVLERSSIRVPLLADYAGRLWDFWELNLAPTVSRNPRLARAIEGKRVLITGASSGIGRATALRVGASGGRVILVARSEDALDAVRREIERTGGSAAVYVADLASVDACDRLVDRVIEGEGGVDVLVNNAGRSIRRSLELSYDRFHDFERTMQLNYFGALKLILGFLPGMRERRSGQIINVSTLGVQAHAPRYSAYAASKAALDTFAMCAAPELVDDRVAITTVHMPLVDTQMIAPTPLYRSLGPISAERAAGMLCDAMIRRPTRVSTVLGVGTQLAHIAVPSLYDTVASMVYRLFPDTAASKSESSDETNE